MSGDRYFRMAQGAEIVGQDADTYEMHVTMPTDDDGCFGRQCPACSLFFRMDVSDYEELPDELQLWCVYCGHHDDHSEFLTEQQRERALRAVEDLGIQLISRELGKAFRSRPEASSRRSGVTFRYESAPFRPRALPDIDEERLVRVRTCSGCQIRYAVFGEHRFCPVCGQLPAHTVALDALQADRARLNALESLPDDAKKLLREQGVFTRNWVDTIENVVGVVETLSGCSFRVVVPDADARLRRKGSIFQRLDDLAEIFVSAGCADVRTELGPATWGRLTETWAVRHLFTHNDGIVDERYLKRVPHSTARVGQRLTITEADCRQALDDATLLCQAIADLSGVPPISSADTGPGA